MIADFDETPIRNLYGIVETRDSPENLEVLFYTHVHKQCSDKSDKIYALLGIAQKHNGLFKELEPRYQ